MGAFYLIKYITRIMENLILSNLKKILSAPLGMDHL